MLDHGTFFLPGPTEVRPAILDAMRGPMLPHRGPAFETLFGRCLAGMQRVMRTTRPVIVSTSSATGLMEGAIRCAPDGPVLCLVNGAFSDRFARVAKANGREVTVLDVPWGQVVAPEALEAALRARRHAAVAFVHSETSTGAAQDVPALAAIARAHGAMSIVDSVTGVAGMPVEPDAWGLDYVLTGSQKALALPPGLAFGVASAAYVEHARTLPARGSYFDVVEFLAFAEKRQTPNTPAISLLHALDAQLAAIAAEGIETRWARHAEMTRQVHDWIAERRDAGRGVGILAPAGARAHTVTVITLPAGIAGPAVVAAMERRGFVIGGGYGKTAPGAVRIGHMGDHTPRGLARCLAALTEALDEVAG